MVMCPVHYNQPFGFFYPVYIFVLFVLIHEKQFAAWRESMSGLDINTLNFPSSRTLHYTILAIEV